MDVRVGLCEEGWVPKNWCFWTVVLEKTLESPLNCKEIQPVHSKGDQFWMFIGKTHAEAETPILWPPHTKSWLIGKDPDAGRDWRQEEKGTKEDEMAGWHHWLDGCEWVNSGSWWWTGVMLQFMGLQRVGHNWATELNCFDYCCYCWLTKLCSTLCDLMDYSMPDSSVLHYWPRACSNSYPLRHWHYLAISSSAYPFCFCLNLSQHQDLLQWVSSSHQVVKALELQLQQQYFQ